MLRRKELLYRRPLPGTRSISVSQRLMLAARQMLRWQCLHERYSSGTRLCVGERSLPARRRMLQIRQYMYKWLLQAQALLRRWLRMRANLKLLQICQQLNQQGPYLYLQIYRRTMHGWGRMLRRRSSTLRAYAPKIVRTTPKRVQRQQ